MNENKVYLEKLNDPRWKNKCRKILTRDGYKCTKCGSKKKLQVHHTFYYDNYPDPWNYPNKSLITVCEKCHREYHEYHEIEIKKPKGKYRNKKIKLNKSKLFQGIPKRILTKKKHGRFYIYDLKQEY